MLNILYRASLPAPWPLPGEPGQSATEGTSGHGLAVTATLDDRIPYGDNLGGVHLAEVDVIHETHAKLRAKQDGRSVAIGVQ